MVNISVVKWGRRWSRLLLAGALVALASGASGASQLTRPPVPPTAAPLATFDAAWQAIRETYIDASRSDEEWQRLHQEFRARAAAATDDTALRPVIRDLLAAIGRSHFELVPGAVHDRFNLSSAAARDLGDIGLEITAIAGELVVTRVEEASSSDELGIRPGWVVESLDGVHARELPSSSAAPAPHDAFRAWATATALLRGPVGSTVQLQLRNGEDRVVTVSVARRRQAGTPVKFGHLPTFFARVDERWLAAPGGRRVAYIHFNVWMTPIAGDLDHAFATARRADGVVLDLRQNPGGVLTMLMGVSGHFLSEPVSLGTVRTRESELELTANPRFVGPDGSTSKPYAGKLAILVDSSSYSASEIFAGGMQALGRARVFGSQSPGGALPAMLRRLPNGDILEYAIGDFVTPRGERIEGRGVIPDEVVPLTRAALLAGGDPPLAAALAWMADETTPAVRQAAPGEAGRP